jgi:purine nucleosidase/pyrimidine-specific ribonucleoside hydrolase
MLLIDLTTQRTQQREHTMTVRVLLDTDIGDDIDDAWAVSLCLRHPEIRLVGITTVWRDTVTRAALARLLVESARVADVEVAAGNRDALDQILDPGKQTYAEVLEDKDQGLRQGRTDAVRFMAETIRNNPGLTLISIGPLTNVARLYMEFPKEFAMISGHVMMCGDLIPGRQDPEYNAGCDPRATRIALSTGIAKFIVGLDVTLKCGLLEEDLKALGAKGTVLASTLYRMTQLWRRSSGALPVMHDPLAVMSTVEKEVTDFKQIRIEADDRGKFVAVEGKPNVNFAADVDPLFLRRRLTEIVG